MYFIKCTPYNGSAKHVLHFGNPNSKELHWALLMDTLNSFLERPEGTGTPTIYLQRVTKIMMRGKKAETAISQTTV